MKFFDNYIVDEKSKILKMLNKKKCKICIYQENCDKNLKYCSNFVEDLQSVYRIYK